MDSRILVRDFTGMSLAGLSASASRARWDSPWASVVSAMTLARSVKRLACIYPHSVVEKIAVADSRVRQLCPRSG